MRKFSQTLAIMPNSIEVKFRFDKFILVVYIMFAHEPHKKGFIMKLNKTWSVLLCFLTFGLAGCSGEVPDNLGVVSGQLAACPDSPNCVSTQATDAEHSMEPLVFTGEVAEAQARILSILEGMERITVITDEPGYIHVEARSRTFRFVDDVEFYFDAEAQLIHFRSASRLGHSDMGVKRNRMQEISDAFQE